MNLELIPISLDHVKTLESFDPLTAKKTAGEWIKLINEGRRHVDSPEALALLQVLANWSAPVQPMNPIN